MKLIGTTAILVVLIGIVAWRSYIPTTPVQISQDDKLQECRAAMLGQLNPRPTDIQSFASIHGLCYAEINEADQLVDFAIRRAALLNQQRQLPVLLWMVVTMTLSGVGLAGIQLYWSYQLTLSGKGALIQSENKVSLAKDGLSLASPFVGLAIILVSFSFFYIFVTQVYLIKELQRTPMASVAGNPSLEAQWLPHSLYPYPMRPAAPDAFPSPPDHPKAAPLDRTTPERNQALSAQAK